MRRDLWGATRVLAVPTVCLLGITALAPGRLDLALRIYALILAAAVIVLALAALRRAYPLESALDLRAAQERRPLQPSSLARVQNEVALGIASAFDLHFRLAPRIRTIASGVLRSRWRISLEASPNAARARLGEDAWMLVTADRPTLEDRLAPGVATRDLERVVSALERA